MFKTICVDHKADFDSVASYAKANGWVPASAGGFPMAAAFQETVSLQSPDTDSHEGVLLYAGLAVFPNQASSRVCMIGMRPGDYQDIRARVEKWMGVAPSKEDAVNAGYVFQEIDGHRRVLPVTLDQASREAAFKNGPVLAVGVSHLGDMTMLSYMVTAGPK